MRQHPLKPRQSIREVYSPEVLPVIMVSAKSNKDACEHDADSSSTVQPRTLSLAAWQWEPMTMYSALAFGGLWVPTMCKHGWVSFRLWNAMGGSCVSVPNDLHFTSVHISRRKPFGKSELLERIHLQLQMSTAARRGIRLERALALKDGGAQGAGEREGVRA